MSCQSSIDVILAAASGVVMECGEGAPKQFVLRGNEACERLLDTLECSGVTFFRCLSRTRDVQTADDFPAMLEIHKGVRLSSAGYDNIKRAASLPIRLTSDAVIEAIEQTSAEGHELLIEVTVNVTDPREINAWAPAIYACEPNFKDRVIPLR